MLSCNIGNFLIKRQSERYIVIEINQPLHLKDLYHANDIPVSLVINISGLE